MRTLLIGLILCGSISACRHVIERGEAPTVAQLVPEDPILADLQEVRLRMTGQELMTARPGLVAAPYIGLREQIGTDTINYLIRGDPDRTLTDDALMPGERMLDPSGTLMAVDFWRYGSASRGLNVLLKEAVGWPGTPRCFRYSHGPASVVAVVRDNKGATLGRLRYGPHSYVSRSGRLEVPPIVRTFVAVSEIDVIPSELPRTAIDCNELLGDDP